MYYFLVKCDDGDPSSYGMSPSESFAPGLKGRAERDRKRITTPAAYRYKEISLFCEVNQVAPRTCFVRPELKRV